MATPSDAVVAELSRLGVQRAGLVGLAVAPGIGLGLATAGGCVAVTTAGPTAGDQLAGITAGDQLAGITAGGCLAVTTAGGVADLLGHVEAALRPRWAMWGNETAKILVESGLRVATGWDVAAVHRLLFGGWKADPARAWAGALGLAFDAIPSERPPDLFSHAELDGGDAEEPVQPDGYLRPEWVRGGWAATAERAARWAELAVVVASRQQELLSALKDRPFSTAVARSESTAELLCVELSHDGLPVDRDAAEQILFELIGPRPRTEAEATSRRAARDAAVFSRIPEGVEIDLRSSAQVKALLGRLGVDLPDTRAWRLRAAQDAHPVVPALLAWRKAERVASTYGYSWLDEHLGADGRLRGNWTGCDGAAGRMTASAGLHNMPADLRPAVVAEPGHVFVCADLGQIEPRVLAAVSADRSLAAATHADDMYAPVAEELGVDRATAKVAVLGAMYGQTTGHGASALRGLRASYPVAMAYLEAADGAGRAGRDLRTHGGRRIAMASPAAAPGVGPAGARGRYGRNAMVQGAAAELFKMWAVMVRARAASCGARILLCLHDELLVQAPTDQADVVAALVRDCLDEAAGRWTSDRSVRFVADISVISRWSEAKESRLPQPRTP